MTNRNSNREFILSIGLYVVSYGLFLAVVIYWVIRLKSLNSDQLGNFLQFIAAISGISALVKEEKLREAELWIRKHISLLSSKATYLRILSWPVRFIAWCRYHLRYIPFEIVGVMFLLLALLILPILFILNLEEVAQFYLPCTKFTSLASLGAVPSYCILIMPPHLNPVVRAIIVLVVLVWILRWISAKLSWDIGDEGPDLITWVIYLVMLGFMIYGATIIAVGWLLGLVFISLFALIAFTAILIYALFLFLSASMIIFLLSPYAFLDKLSLNINPDGSAKVITIFAVVLAILGTFLALLS